MASYFSPDLFLENVCLVVSYLKDGYVTLITDYDTKGRLHESGDLVQTWRGDYEGGDGKAEAAIILGSGEAESDAIKESRAYFQRLAKWHGYKEDLSSFRFLGHDCAQSEILFDQEKSDSEEESSPKRKRAKFE